jgi:hypothetical protein
MLLIQAHQILCKVFNNYLYFSVGNTPVDSLYGHKYFDSTSNRDFDRIDSGSLLSDIQLVKQYGMDRFWVNISPNYNTSTDSSRYGNYVRVRV